MITSQILEQLNQLGLIEREAKVYLALLELGESPVIPIAQKSGIQRTYVYDILIELRKKNLVSNIEKNNRHIFRAENPKILGLQLNAKQETYKELLPELLSINNSMPNKPKVRFFEGKEGILTAYEELLKEKSYDNLAESDNFIKFMGKDYAYQIGLRIAQNKIRVRELFCQPKNRFIHNHSYDRNLQQVRVMPEGYHITTDVCISPTKVYLFSLEQYMHCVIIEDSGIVQTHQIMFNALWDFASIKYSND